jgi:type IV pilus assembly protein PilV
MRTGLIAMKSLSQIAPASKQRGVGLLEVLITALVLAVGLLGMAALQIRSTQFNQSAYIRSQANILAFDIADKMRSNTGAIYNITRDAAKPNGTTMREQDLKQWKTELETSLPSGQGSITCAANNCTITIFWREPMQAAGDADMSLAYTTRI